MPVVAISVERLNQLLHKKYKIEELVTSLQHLGCDVDDTVDMSLYECPFCKIPVEKVEKDAKIKKCDFCGNESDQAFPLIATDSSIRIDLLADRPDFFDPGGLARALKGYMGIQQGLPAYDTSAGDLTINVNPDMDKKESYRPYIVSAVVRVDPLNHVSLKEIMKLQENLHWGIGRDRKLASIGVYDLDTITGPIEYTKIDPDKEKFCPLGMPGKEMTPRQILESHPKGMNYSHLLQDLKYYPVLIDSKGQVLSMPPIINSEETRCKIGTKNLFIDVTGISEAAVINSLNTLVCSLCETGGKVETVNIKYKNTNKITPELTPKKIIINREEASRWIGVDFKDADFKGYLEKMRLSADKKSETDYEVSYPSFRTDVRHEVDIFEDIAIGFGYHNLTPTLIPSMTISKAREEEILSSQIRSLMLGLNFSEIMSLILTSEERHFDKLNMSPAGEHVIVENPKTIDQKIVRSHMMTGIMETLNKNRRKAVPQKIFELGNIIILDVDKETGTSEYRCLAFAEIGPDAGYASGRAALDSILRETGINISYSAENNPSFSEGRSALIKGKNGESGIIGEIHPKVLNNYGLSHPVVYTEIRLKQII